MLLLYGMGHFKEPLAELEHPPPPIPKTQGKTRKALKNTSSAVPYFNVAVAFKVLLPRSSDKHGHRPTTELTEKLDPNLTHG